MASGRGDTSQSDAKEILSQIFSCIGELSNALDGPEGSSNNCSRIGRSDTVEDEVRKVFGPIERRRQHISSTTSSSSLGTNRTSSTTQASVAVAVSPSSEPLQERNPKYTRRYFSNHRSAIKSNRWKRGKDPKTKKVSTGPFSRDIILLSGPDDKDIPRQGNKVFLQENGHIISAFEFQKEWSDIDVELEMRNAFQGTLPDDVDIEIVHSVHTTLLQPTLAPGQYFTGSVINRVFSNNKPVYIRPCRQILHQPINNKEKRQRYHLPENVFDDDDDDFMPPALQGKKCWNVHFYALQASGFPV
jgi:hypothetical protein